MPTPAGDSDQLIACYIAAHPRRASAGEALLAEYDISVWAIIGYLRAVDGDIELAAHDYRIPVDAVRAALAYYERHREVIDDRIADNSILVP